MFVPVSPAEAAGLGMAFVGAVALGMLLALSARSYARTWNGYVRALHRLGPDEPAGFRVYDPAGAELGEAQPAEPVAPRE